MAKSTYEIQLQRIRKIVEAAGTARHFTGYSPLLFRDDSVQLVITRNGTIWNFPLGSVSEIESMSNEALELLIAKKL